MTQMKLVCILQQEWQILIWRHSFQLCFENRTIIDSPPFLKIHRHSTQQRIRIVKHYFKNGESLIATIRKFRPIFSSQIVPSKSNCEEIIRKFEETGFFKST